MRWAPHSYALGFQADLLIRLLSEVMSVSHVLLKVHHVNKDGKNSALNFRIFYLFFTIY